jgi:site-specific DNA recombinase
MQEKAGLLQTLESECKKVSADMEKVTRLFFDDKISGDGFNSLYRPLEERLKQLQNELRALQGQLDFLKIQRLSSDQIFTEAKDLYARWRDLELTEKRRAVESITEKIVVANGQRNFTRADNNCTEYE